MSLQSTFATGFRNFGHAIAVAAKYTAIGLEDILKVANKAQVIEPEVAAVVGALAGPIGSNLTALAFHGLGDIATALEPLTADAEALRTGQLTIQLDVKTLNDIRAVIPQLKAVIVALGASIPVVSVPKP